MNNYERIKTMTIDEIAAEIATIGCALQIVTNPLLDLQKEKLFDSNFEVLEKWLQQESEGNNAG